MMFRQPHVVVVPYPAQGHVTPLMKLSYRIADYGVKVTFVNTEFIHGKLMAAMPAEMDKEQHQIELVPIPDGLGPEDDRKDALKVAESIRRVMPGHLKDLIEKIDHHSENDEQVCCLIADANLLWILEVAKEIGIEQVAMFPAGGGSLAVSLHIPNLVLEAGIADIGGDAMGNEFVRPSKEIPGWSSTEITWSSVLGDPNIRKILFETLLTLKQITKVSKWLLCNTCYELDSLACDLIPNILPVGPLLASNDPRHCSGSFQLEDSSCLSWLDEQPAGSVIYIAFGSTGFFSQHQFNELAHGLELAGRPFLWIVRSDVLNGSFAEYPDGFMERVADRGKIAEWAPQEKVLAHPSIACFISHCGWNSTLDGLSMGVPFLCWPYFGDQFQNQNYICDIWKIGLRLKPDETKIISRHEIKTKIEILLSGDDIKANGLELKEMARRSINKGGSSCTNFESFIQHLKQLVLL